MEPNAIIYTSNTGYTRQYAVMLGEKTGLPVYSLNDKKEIPSGCTAVYLGWLMAGKIKGYGKAAKLFNIAAVCGVGLSETGTLIDEVSKSNSIPAGIPLFTLQGGFDRDKLKGINKFMISMLTKGLASKKQLTEQEQQMFELLNKDASYVSEENLRDILYWYASKGCTVDK